MAIVSNELCISIASIWEIAIKASLLRDERRLKMKGTVNEFVSQCESMGIELLPITTQDCQRVMSLPHIHEDPFDRMILAQSLNRGIPLVTKDENLWKYDEAKLV